MHKTAAPKGVTCTRTWQNVFCQNKDIQRFSAVRPVQRTNVVLLLPFDARSECGTVSGNFPQQCFHFPLALICLHFCFAKRNPKKH